MNAACSTCRFSFNLSVLVSIFVLVVGVFVCSFVCLPVCFLKFHAANPHLAALPAAH